MCLLFKNVQNVFNPIKNALKTMNKNAVSLKRGAFFLLPKGSGGLLEGGLKREG